MNRIKDSYDFLQSLELENLIEIFGADVKFKLTSKNMLQILVESHDEFVLIFKRDNLKFYISSMASSVSFILKNKLYTETEMCQIYQYSEKYYKSFNELGAGYGPFDMFDCSCISVLPACIVVVGENGECIQKVSWLDALEGLKNEINIETFCETVTEYTKDKNVVLLTSGGVDTALLLHATKNSKKIMYASNNYKSTGGNNDPKHARILLSKMKENVRDDNFIEFHIDMPTKQNQERLYNPDIDYDVMTTLGGVNDNIYVISGQNSDAIISPGYIKGDTYLSIIRNWGVFLGIKSIIVNALLHFWDNKFIRQLIIFLFSIVNIFLRKKNHYRVEYTPYGFFMGFHNSVPFVIKTRFESNEMIEKYKEIQRLSLLPFSYDRKTLQFINMYSYCFGAQLSRRGVVCEGYRYILPYQSACYYALCYKRQRSLSEILIPKNILINFLNKVAVGGDHVFYSVNEDT